MKITKFRHSCLLVETPDRVVLFDPGDFSWNSGLLRPDNLTRLDTIVITHEHLDHFYLPAVQALMKQFPEAEIITTPSVVSILAESGIAAASESREGLEIEFVGHEKLEPWNETPEYNIVAHFLRQLTHPGDSHHFTHTQSILALPVNAPWGTWPRAVELGLALKPQVILPIHDWHLSEEARANMYRRLTELFAQHDIRFISLVDGQAVEL